MDDTDGEVCAHIYIKILLSIIYSIIHSFLFVIFQ